MRTTLNVDDDVLDRARALATKRKVPFRLILNEALRAGLSAVEKPAKSRPYKTVARDMGHRPGMNLDNIQDLLAQVEGEDSR